MENKDASIMGMSCLKCLRYLQNIAKYIGQTISYTYTSIFQDIPDISRIWNFNITLFSKNFATVTRNLQVHLSLNFLHIIYCFINITIFRIYNVIYYHAKIFWKRNYSGNNTARMPIGTKRSWFNPKQFTIKNLKF